MQGDWLGKLFLLVLIVVAGALAAITRAPDAWWVEKVSRAALFGPWIERFADLYRQDEAAPDPSELEGGVEVVYRIDTQQNEARAMIQIPEGRVLYPEPIESTNPLALLPESTVELFDRRQDWYEIESGGQRGWVRLRADGRIGPVEPPLGSEPEPPLPVPSSPPDPEILARALELLGDSAETKTLAGYTLHTDVRNRGLLTFLSATAAQLESIYESRYGLEPLPGSLEAVVLFSLQDDFEEFLADAGQGVDGSAPGVVHGGVVATYSEGRPWNEVASTLVHELTHLLNKRALGPALPPWLDEGIASDLGQSRIEGLRLYPGTIGGSVVRSSGRTQYRGAQASVLELARAADAGSLTALEKLLALDAEGFQQSQLRWQNYGQSAFFVRSLLDAPDPDLPRAFRAFLRDVSLGKPVTAEALRSKLGRSWQALDRDLAAFVTRQAKEAGLPASGESGSSSRQANEPSA